MMRSSTTLQALWITWIKFNSGRSLFHEGECRNALFSKVKGDKDFSSRNTFCFLRTKNLNMI